jgi:3-deoxy-D-manno-octulosonic-acid transferase
VLFRSKYEFWHYYLTGLKKRQIPTILIAGIFRKDQLFFKWYGGFYKNLLHCFSAFFVQDQRSESLLHSIGIHDKVYIGGDTRYDRVIEIANAFLPIDPIAHFCNNSLVLVAGSTWFQDDETIAHFEKVNQHIKFIIAPHDITHQRLQNCLTLYKNAVLYSDYVKGFNSSPQNFNTLIIDNIGMLSKLYHYATVTFIGGGFGADGIHNCLEAAVHYKPVLFGPVFDKYIEAAALVDTGGAISIKDALDFERVANKLFSNEADRKNMGQLAGDFIHAHKGATTKIVTYIQEKRLLTSGSKCLTVTLSSFQPIFNFSSR